MYYNTKTKQLQSAAPWGNSYIDDELKAVIYKDWEVVADDFIPPVNEASSKPEAKIGGVMNE